MLRHSLGEEDAAALIEAAVSQVIESGALTRDVGGSATTEEVGGAVCAALSAERAASV